MGRQHTFMDREFGRGPYDPDDRGTYDEGLVFLMMPFVSEDSRQVFEAIRDECAGLGLRVTRVDEGGGSGFIIREVTALIEQAEFIICDLSHERPNVYYELGYAHGCGNEADDILLIARAGTRLHFDIAPLRVHYFESIPSLRSIVRHQMERMIRTTRR